MDYLLTFAAAFNKTFFERPVFGDVMCGRPGTGEKKFSRVLGRSNDRSTFAPPSETGSLNGRRTNKKNKPGLGRELETFFDVLSI